MTDSDRVPSIQSDPSPLSTQALWREVAALKELFSTRLDAMDKAMILFNDNLTRVPTDTDKQILSLRTLIFQRFETDGEKFNNIDTQFRERDTRSEEAEKYTKTAVDAAFAAQKEAVAKQTEAFSQSIDKSEGNTIKQIDQLGALLQQSIKANDEKISDIKDRLIRIEGTGKGRADVWGWVVAAGAVLVSVAIAVLK